MSSGNVYEMLWDCQYCGTTGNLGLTHRFCPNCGAPQNPDSRYYPSDEDKVEVKDHVYVGVDVICPSCSELNSAAAEFCGQCGAPLTEGARAKRLEAQSRASHEEFDSSGSRDLVKEKFQAEQQAIAGITGKKKRQANDNLKVIGAIVLIVIIAGAIFAAFSIKNEVSVIVSEHRWERTIDIERYDDFTVRSWRDSPPPGDSVFMVPGSCRQEQRSTRRVPDGETCRTVRQDNGDGTFSERQQCTTNYREEPVYDDRCTWEGFHWVFHREVNTIGDLNETPQWPDISLDCEGQRRLGCERESGRAEMYWVNYENTEDRTEYRCGYDRQQWESIPPESFWVGHVRALMPNSLLCDSLVRQN